MNSEDRAAALGRAPIFYGLSDAILGRLAAVTEVVDVAADETFITAGDVEPWMYLIVSGQARVHAGDRDIAIATPGTTVGELAVLDPAPRSADVTATEATRMLRLDHAHLADLMAEEPELVDGILAMLVRVIRASSEKIGPGPVSAV